MMKMTRTYDPPLEWVHQAGIVEHAVSRAGWQDYLPAVYGGFNVYRIEHSECWLGMKHTGTPPWATDIINRYGLLLYTGISRPADSVLGSWQKSEAQLHQIKELADKVAGEIDDLKPDTLGGYLDLAWHYKRSISGVSNGLLDTHYDIALQSGALGGKLCGAGAGGCWFFLVDPANRERVKNALQLREIPFQIAEKGVETWEL